jgi:tetratricopeptide (TPR) repeat protein
VPSAAASDPSRPSPESLVGAGMRARARGDFATADGLLRAALADAEAARPVDPALLAAALNAMGLVCKDLARHNEGTACYERALALLGGAPDAHAHEIATLHHNLAGMAHARRDFAAAEPIARRGLAIRAHAAEPAPYAMAADMIALGAILDGLLRFDEAERLYLDAVTILSEAPVDDAVAQGDLAAALNNLGAQCACRERHADAVVHLERALELKRRVHGARHPDVAVSLHNLAVATRRLGDEERAARMLADAESIFVSVLGDGHPRTQRCRAQLDRWRASA